MRCARPATLVFGAALVLALLLAPSPRAGAIPSPARVPSSVLHNGPAVATLSFQGSGGLAGRVVSYEVDCNQPGLTGTSIFLLADASAAGVGFNIRLFSAKIVVEVASGSGKAYKDRVFTGTGVTAFNPAVGARISTRLTEARAVPGQKKGSLGALTSVKGSVSCGNQRPGSSTIIFSGGTAEGRVDGRLNPARRRLYLDSTFCCQRPGSGDINVGHGRALLFVTLAKPDVAIWRSLRRLEPGPKRALLQRAGGRLAHLHDGAGCDRRCDGGGGRKQRRSRAHAAHGWKATCGAFTKT